jgi:uncharacterized iron-regulated membrane protein
MKYQIKEYLDRELVAVGKYGEETIHIVHCAKTLEELSEDSAKIYIVAEECTNFARLHLVTDFSEDEALQQVDEYLTEEEGEQDTHLIGVFEAEL